MHARVLSAAVLLGALMLGAAFWWSGGADALARWAASGQRDFQTAMAGAVRALRTGDAGALAGLLTVCFAYGFFHAVGPGHGKILIGGYGMARRVPALRLAGIAVLSSLAQAATAVLLVHAGLSLLGLSRRAMEGAAEDWLQPASHAAIAAIGAWLVWRGARGLLLPRDGHGRGGNCGHAHGPAPEDVARLGGWRDTALLVASIAIRPCTGALLLLIVTWQLGVAGAGIAGAFAIGLGTAFVTVLVALGATGLRESAFRAWAGGQGAALLAPAIEMLAGLCVLLAAGAIFLRSF